MRSRLLSQMDQPGAVVTIVAPPVSGKTSLAASWTNLAWNIEREADIFWYQINNADEDIATFFQLIERAIVRKPISMASQSHGSRRFSG
jgi:ATP/maltotriose-dependent transcriptional regulator MalT